MRRQLGTGTIMHLEVLENFFEIFFQSYQNNFSKNFFSKKSFSFFSIKPLFFIKVFH